MPSPEYRVIIIGGGITGLCLAQGLKKAGIEVVLYERDRTRTDRLQGYRLSLAALGCRSLYECLPSHLYDAFSATCGKPTTTVRLLSENLEELVTIPKKEPYEPIDNCHSVSRITLRQILLSGLDEVVHFDKAFSHYEEAGDTVTAFFEDGTSVSGNILIGADGGNSRIRKQLLPHAQRSDTGIRVLAGKVPLTDEIKEQLPSSLIGGVTSIMTPRGCGMFIGRQEFQPGADQFSQFSGSDENLEQYGGLLFDNTQSYVMWALCARREKFNLDTIDNTDSEQILKLSHQICHNWHPAFHAMMDLSEKATISKFKIHYALPVEHWKTGTVTLIGDAIHSMPPMGGVGTSIGLRDASLLCQNIVAANRQEKSLKQALHDYEVEMLQYGFSGVQQSIKIAEKFVEDSAFSPFLMKNMLRVMNVLPGVKAKVFATLG